MLAFIFLAGTASAFPFVRGDVNGDGATGVADLVFLSRCLGAPDVLAALPCPDAADIDDDGRVTPADAAAFVECFFSARQVRLPAPFPFPGEDPTDDALGCAASDKDRRDGDRPHSGGSDLEYIHFACRAAVARPGESIRVPVVVKTIRPLSGASFALRYDPNVLAAVGFDTEGVGAVVGAGQVWVNDSALAEGRLAVSFLFEQPAAHAHDLPAWTYLTLGTLDLRVAPEAAPGTSVTLRFADLPLAGAPGCTWIDNEAADTFGRAFDLERHAAALSITVVGSVPFVRGDADRSGKIDPADAISLLRYLFARGTPLSCPDAADVNDDGRIDISDPLSLLRYLWARGRCPATPFPMPGIDGTDDRLEPCRGP